MLAVRLLELCVEFENSFLFLKLFIVVDKTTQIWICVGDLVLENVENVLMQYMLTLGFVIYELEYIFVSYFFSLKLKYVLELSKIRIDFSFISRLEKRANFKYNRCSGPSKSYSNDI